MRSVPKSCSASAGSSASAIVPRTSGTAISTSGSRATTSTVASANPISPNPSVTCRSAGPATSSSERRKFSSTLVLRTLIATISETPVAMPPITSAVRPQLPRRYGRLRWLRRRSMRTARNFLRGRYRDQC